MTQTVPATVAELRYEVDVNTLSRKPPMAAADAALGLNGIGRVVLSAHRPLIYDPYRQNRGTGCFVLIDPVSYATVAAGMLIARQPTAALPTEVVDWHEAEEESPVPGRVGREERAERLGHGAATVWLTGLPSSGAREVGALVERALFERGWGRWRWTARPSGAGCPTTWSSTAPTPTSTSGAPAPWRAWSTTAGRSRSAASSPRRPARAAARARPSAATGSC